MKNNLIKKFDLFFLVLIMASPIWAWSQVQVTGKTISAEDGAVLPGVNVVEEGSTNGVVSDFDGNYIITISSKESILLYSYLGHLTVKESVGNRTIINVSLAEDVSSFDEVVVIGYGSVKKSDVTGSVSSIKGEELKAFPVSNVLQAMSGRSAGVQVKQNTGAPGAPISVRIRGTNSIQGSNEPLYVIDGFPTASSNPDFLNNYDIQSMEILKDASAVAIYGSRGANGVVLITTNRGKAGRTTVDFEISTSSQKLSKKLDMMNAQEYSILYNEQQVNDGLGAYFTEQEINNFGEGYDWQDLVYTNALVQNYSLNVNGGTEKTQFSISGGLFDQDGIIKGSDYKRYSLRAFVNHDVSKLFSIEYSANLSKTSTSRKNSEGARFGASLISASLLAPPTLSPYNEDGSYRILSIAYPFQSEGMTNPLNFINEISDEVGENNVLVNTALVFRPMDGLILRINGGIENTDSRSDYYRTLKYVNSQGNASVSTNQYTSLLNENTLSYNKTINDKHNLSAVAGFTFQNFTSKSLSGAGQGFLSDVTETHDLSSASIPGIPGTSYSKSVLLSYLGRANYSFDNRYLLTASLRADGSSKYSEGNKWGYFPSGAFAWKVSEEDFFQDISFIGNLKLRASWGITGSQAINAYATLNNLYSGKTVFADGLYTTFSPSTTLPGNLKWETTTQTNFGIDLAILENRIQLTADYYNKNTEDLLNTVQLPSSMGFSRTIRNVGEINNKGFEFTVNTHILTGEFQWSLDANIAFNKTKVVKLYDGQDILGGYVDMLVFADNINLLREGEEMGIFYGYLEDGYDDEGNIKYQDIDGSESVDQDDKTIIGNPNADFVYGLNSRMSFKNFDLTMFFQGSQGNDLVNISKVDNSLVYGYGDNLLKEVFYDHWTPNNTDAKYPKITRNQSMRFSDRLVEDGSYFRMRNIELAYSLPTTKLRSDWIRKLQIYVSGQNLLTFTKYSGWDPEINSRGGSNSIAQGIDHYSYPPAKSATLGLRMGF